MTDKLNPQANEKPDAQVLSHTMYTKQAAKEIGHRLHLLFGELDTIPPESQTSEWCWNRLINLLEHPPSLRLPYEYFVAARNGLHEIYDETHPQPHPES